MTEAAQTGPPTEPAPGTPAGDAARHEIDREIQAVIVELARTGSGRPVGDLVPQLEATLAQRGITDQPRSWLDVVAREASAGRIYVQTNEALSEVTDLPVRGGDPERAAEVVKAVTGDTAQGQGVER
ncbi:MAG TPA: hypothetical protein VFJ97_08755 [Dermatophilaceae bacterium]|nr:hypothetical protein [Dermatophilaceae bacterium]